MITFDRTKEFLEIGLIDVTLDSTMCYSYPYNCWQRDMKSEIQ